MLCSNIAGKDAEEFVPGVFLFVSGGNVCL